MGDTLVSGRTDCGKRGEVKRRGGEGSFSSLPLPFIRLYNTWFAVELLGLHQHAELDLHVRVNRELSEP
jgi:hypothetical protein